MKAAMSDAEKPDAEELAFAAEFPAATREQWLKLEDGVLKGAPFDKRELDALLELGVAGCADLRTLQLAALAGE